LETWDFTSKGGKKKTKGVTRGGQSLNQEGWVGVLGERITGRKHKTKKGVMQEGQENEKGEEQEGTWAWGGGTLVESTSRGKRKKRQTPKLVKRQPGSPKGGEKKSPHKSRKKKKKNFMGKIERGTSKEKTRLGHQKWPPVQKNKVGVGPNLTGNPGEAIKKNIKKDGEAVNKYVKKTNKRRGLSTHIQTKKEGEKNSKTERERV